MNSEKAELKILIATDIGASIEDLCEAAKKDMYRQEGAVLSFGAAAKAAEGLCAAVNADLDEDKISMEQAELIKLWLTRAANAARNLGRGAENLGNVACGKIAALEGAMKLTEDYRRVEQLKLAAARVSPAPPANTASVPAEVPLAQPAQPRLTLKARRLAQEAQQAVQPVPEQPAPEVMPKRRGRPPSKRR